MSKRGKHGNKFMKARVSVEKSTLRKSNNWERDGLIWRTPATDPKGL
jgi:hypothetical protein